MDHRESLPKLLRQMASTLEHASPADVDALLQGRAELVISGRENRRPVKSESAEDRRASSAKLDNLASQLKMLTSRDEGRNLLDRAKLTKKELERLARLMDLPVLREDDAEKLRQRILEHSIGARLNSQAIRG